MHSRNQRQSVHGSTHGTVACSDVIEHLCARLKSQTFAFELNNKKHAVRYVDLLVDDSLGSDVPADVAAKDEVVAFCKYATEDLEVRHFAMCGAHLQRRTSLCTV